MFDVSYNGHIRLEDTRCYCYNVIFMSVNLGALQK